MMGTADSRTGMEHVAAPVVRVTNRIDGRRITFS